MTLIGRLWRSIENPSTPLSDAAEWLYDALGGEAGASGLRLNSSNLLSYSPVWRGVYLLANCIGMLPLYVYRRDSDGEGKHYATNHPAYMLLRRKPNREMSAFVFRQIMQAQAILEGTGYAYISRRGNGDPDELIPLTPGSTHPVRVNGKLWYWHQDSNRQLPAADVLALKGPGLDGLVGHRLSHKAKDSIGAGKAAELYAGKFFSNGAEPRVILEHPNKLSREAQDKLKASWNAMHQGLDNSHKTAVLEEGMKLHNFGVDPEKSQLIATRKFGIIDVANWLQIPPHFLGDETRTAYASLEQEMLSFLQFSLDPWLVNWESECWDKLLTEKQKRDDSHTIEYMRQALLRGDASSRAQYYHNGLLDGWLNIDEIRARENLNPLPDGHGKKHYRPLNVGIVGEPDPQPDPPDNARGAVRAVLADAVRRMAKRLCVHAGKKELDEHRNVLLEALAPALQADATVRRVPCDPARCVDAMLCAVRDYLKDHPADERELCRVMLDTLETDHETA